jgi:preprotein translocase subunit SecE
MFKVGEYIKDFIAEAKRVIWPNKKELISKTSNVIIMSLFVSVIIFVMDVVFSQGLNLLHQLVVK